MSVPDQRHQLLLITTPDTDTHICVTVFVWPIDGDYVHRHVYRRPSIVYTQLNISWPWAMGKQYTTRVGRCMTMFVQ